jgi:hypothetical protein
MANFVPSGDGVMAPHPEYPLIGEGPANPLANCCVVPAPRW